MAACVAVGVWLGWLIDNFFGTSPWFLLICSLLGVGAAIKAMFDLANK